MNTELETALRAAFRDETDGLLPAPALVERVRKATARRRLSLAGGAFLVAAGVAASYALAGGQAPHNRQSLDTTDDAPTVSIAVTGGVNVVAAAGSMLYVASGDVPDGNAALTVYDSTSGVLIRTVPVPARPQAISVGADGSVWLTFYPDQHGGGSGVWRLSPDLSQRSMLDSAGLTRATPFDVLSDDGDRALLATDFGLASVVLHDPAAQLGDATLIEESAKPTGRTPVKLARLGDEVVILTVPEVAGANQRIVVNGHPDFRYDAGLEGTVTSMSPGLDGLWVTVSAHGQGSLLRLNDQLRSVEPGPVVDDPDLAHPQAVLAHGHTVWVGTGQSPLVCFVFAHDQVIKATVATDGTPAAATDDQIFVTTPAGITGYRVPAPCR